ncbi:hypothetical protein [Flexivirga alba]|uniref:Exo-alpha-sialidase n=1 Tax=Flexivirga alba TaxID=702742 RepID=A0ABW2AGJ0_9MICO
MKLSLAGGVVGVLVVVNAAAFVAVEQHFQVATGQVAAGPSSAQPAAADVGASSPSANVPAKSTTPPVVAHLGAPSVVVTAVNATRAWRAANSGGCAGSVQVQATKDGGVTWTTLAASPAGTADGIGIDGNGHLQLSGQAANGCTHNVWTLDTGAWSASTSPASWAPAGAQSPDVIHNGHRAKACDAGSVIDLAVAGDTADVLCSTGAVRAVPAGGAAKTIYQSADALSIGTTKDNSLVVAQTEEGCDGVELATVSGGSAKKITCVQGASKAVDLTFAGNHGWLVAAHNTWTGGTSGDWSKS